MSTQPRSAGGVCGGCPYRSHCHVARQQAVEQRGLGVGRHYLCQFYQEHRARNAPRVARPGFWARLWAHLGAG